MEAMADKAFGFKNTRDDYHRYLEKFKKTIPDSQNNLQAISVKDSCHVDYDDLVLFVQYEMSFFNLIQGVSMVKAQGSGIEFHEFAVCLWLDFLLKAGLHNDTFTASNIHLRLKQFNDLLEYDHRLGDG